MSLAQSAQSAHPTQPDHTAGALADLAAGLTGRLATPADADWDQVRSAWNLAVDQRPDAVAQVADAADVGKVVAAALASGRRVAPQGTGHAAAALGDLSGTILLRTDRLREVTVDAAARSARVGAGVLWAEVIDAAAAHGLAALSGSAPDVGVVGYTLGGGFSWFARSFGLAVNQVTAVELVTGDGEFHRVTATSTGVDAELFWAVRGGGANVGVVTALEFDLFERTEVYAGALFFPIERAAEVLRAYRSWTADLDEAATTSIRLLRVPPLPELPEPLRGNAFVVVNGVIDLPAGPAGDLLAPIRALEPAIDMFRPMPVPALAAVAMDPPQPVPAAVDGMKLAVLDDEVIGRLLEIAGPGVATPLLTVDLRHLGGAAGRPVDGGGVVDHLEGEFLVSAVGMAMTPEMGAAVQGAITAALAALAPFGTEHAFATFLEHKVDPSVLWGSGLDRLRATRSAVDPHGIIRANHEV